MIDNLFADLSRLTRKNGQNPQDRERFDTLLVRPGLKIERIVSTGQGSPPGFWYDQPEGEWVLVLQGDAELRFADESEVRRLGPGDFVHIAPHRRHRVESTRAEPSTVWLAIHYDSGPK